MANFVLIKLEQYKLIVLTAFAAVNLHAEPSFEIVTYGSMILLYKIESISYCEGTKRLSVLPYKD